MKIHNIDGTVLSRRAEEARGCPRNPRRWGEKRDGMELSVGTVFQNEQDRGCRRGHLSVTGSASSAQGGAGMGPGGTLEEWPGGEDHVMLGFSQLLGRFGCRGQESKCRIKDLRMVT